MGETKLFQPLTREDKLTVVVYRAGIVLSSLVLALSAYIAFDARNQGALGLKTNALLIALYASVGLSVFFIHLYVSKFHRGLKKMYYISLAALILLFVLGKGDASSVLLHQPYGPLLLLPLSLCLGFVAAKEAFCFRLIEGYLLAMIMPFYLVLISAGALSTAGIAYGAALIAAMLIFFTLRKVLMPIHYDIGDKSAYC